MRRFFLECGGRLDAVFLQAKGFTTFTRRPGNVPLGTRATKATSSGRTPNLSSREVLGDEAVLQQLQISLRQIEVCAGDHSLTFICSYPINHLRRVGPEIGGIVFVDGFTVFSREHPDVGVLSLANVVEVFGEAG